ncbi:MAG: CHAT domain-containing protein [Nitrospira sp.]|nr:CHAT domain-containing protein [Nitrospira sp.]
MAKPKPEQRRGSISSSSRRQRPSRRAAKDAQGRQGRNGLAAYSYREDQIEDALATGKDADLLKSYFGEAQYQELRELATQAQRRTVRGGPRVLILPGIMGSTIGKGRSILDDVLWFDPVDIARGRLSQLALDGSPDNFTALGAIPLAYTGLRLRLKSAGFDAEFHYYDWRKGLDVLGEGLVTQLQAESVEQVGLVAHSMGGLVARAAITRDSSVTRKISRLVMLGTPNHGSFAPVQAIRAVYPVVKQVAAIDLVHDAEELSSLVFTTFPGLYQLLPTKEVFNDVDLFEVDSWPTEGPKPQQSLLVQVPPVQQSLAPADDRFFLIAGVNQETVVDLELRDNEFVYQQSIEGDGTVPKAFAELEGTKTYYIEESHGSLPNNRLVAQATIDILQQGDTSLLPQQWAPSQRSTARALPEQELRTPAYGGRKGKELTEQDIRYALDGFVAPDSRTQPVVAGAPVAAAAAQPTLLEQPLNQVIVGRRRQHRLDIRLALGSITELDSRAYVLGIYRNVAPSGPADALDERMGGAIRDFTARRMFAGNVGEVFVMPTGRHPLQADFIIFVGLGDFDRFSDTVLQVSAENIVRTCIRTSVEEFGTVLLGGRSGQDIDKALQDLLTGFFRALKDTDGDHWFRRITVCEMNQQRYQDIRSALLRLATTPLFDDIEVTFDEARLKPPLVPSGLRASKGPEPAYLLVRQEAPDQDKGMLSLTSSILTPGSKASVITDTQHLTNEALDRHFKKVESPSFSLDTLTRFGDELAHLVLPQRILAVLPQMKQQHLVVVHDAPSSRIPWETIQINGWAPAISQGLSRRYLAGNLSVAKWLEQRQRTDKLKLLLVVNPTQDLPGAEREGERIESLFSAQPGVVVEKVHGPQATKSALLKKFQSGAYDVVHYAGHAFFDPRMPARSGILCHGKEILNGADLAAIGNLPSLVFFNACEAGRIRKPPEKKQRDLDMDKRIERAVGLAEAFLRGGVANYVGTYWPVGDQAAEAFAQTFYMELLRQKTIGAALLAGRERVRTELKSVDWADYIHYGSYDFALKQG